MKIVFLLVGLATAALTQENSCGSSCSEGLPPSLTRFRNKLYEKIQMRAAKVPCSKMPEAQKISSNTWDNFKNCENDYMILRNKLNYKKCLKSCFKMAMTKIKNLETDGDEDDYDDDPCGD